MIDNDWLEYLKPEFRKEYYKDLFEFVKKAYSESLVFPPADDIFNALKYTPISNVKVVLVGQDPYHEPGQAHGLSFSVLPGVKTPPSLQNMYKELKDEYGYDIPNNGYLKKWADQGVLLLNTVLTVKAHLAHSHKDIGWETFTDKVIEVLNQHRQNLVFLLWGSPAQKKGSKIDERRHLVLKAAHPSPLSAHRGFFGCRHFSQANQYLRDKGIKPIDWQI